MTSSSERTPQGGLGRLVAATVLFALVAPVASAAAPLAALLVVSRPRSTAEVSTAVVAGGFSLWWLLQPGTLPEQLLKAMVVLTTTIFVMTTVRSKTPFLSRGLIGLGGAIVGTTALLLTLGSSWGELRWWVEHQAGLDARIVAGQLGARQGTGGWWFTTAEQMESWLSTMVRLAADYFPAVAALELLAGLAVATAIYHRVARHPLGSPLGRFRLFRFSEQLGWLAVVSLVSVLVPKLAALKLTGANILVVAGMLYALRGAAVGAFGLSLVGGMSFFLWALSAVIFFLMLPVFVGGAILLGVLDTGVDFRRRWTTPRVGK